MKAPRVTLAVVTVAAVIAASGATAQSALVYDRDRILSGEFWRLITGNWVHFSVSHLTYDMLAFGIAGVLIESRCYPGFRSFCFAAPALIGGAVFLVRSDLRFFGGLSGLATGAIVLLALHGLRDRGMWRWICLVALTGTGAKTAIEFANGQMMFAQYETTLIQPLPEAHVAGVLAAVAVWTIRDLFPMHCRVHSKPVSEIGE